MRSRINHVPTPGSPPLQYLGSALGRSRADAGMQAEHHWSNQHWGSQMRPAASKRQEVARSLHEHCLTRARRSPRPTRSPTSSSACTHYFLSQLSAWASRWGRVAGSANDSPCRTRIGGWRTGSAMLKPSALHDCTREASAWRSRSGSSCCRGASGPGGKCESSHRTFPCSWWAQWHWDNYRGRRWQRRAHPQRRDRGVRSSKAAPSFPAAYALGLWMRGGCNEV